MPDAAPSPASSGEPNAWSAAHQQHNDHDYDNEAKTAADVHGEILPNRSRVQSACSQSDVPNTDRNSRGALGAVVSDREKTAPSSTSGTSRLGGYSRRMRRWAADGPARCLAGRTAAWLGCRRLRVPGMGMVGNRAS